MKWPGLGAWGPWQTVAGGGWRRAPLAPRRRTVLDAASSGDLAWLKQQIEDDPKLIGSVTLVKRRGVLHLAAKQGHWHVIEAVLQPLIEAVRTEYYAHQEAQADAAEQPGAAEEQQQQQQQQPGAAATQQPPEPAAAPQPQPQQQQPPPPPQPQPQQQQPPPPPQQQQQQQPQPPARQQQGATELQLPSFKRLRSTVNARDLYRRTPLIVAAKQGHLECTQLLVEAASNLFAVDREGNTSLHYAALHGHGEVVEYLLRKASDRNLATRFVNKRNLSGFTPLHYAVWGCNEALVQDLLQAGADVSVANDRVFDAWVTVPVGSTPLHLAVVRHSMPIALALLQAHVVQVVSRPAGSPAPADPRTVANLYGMNPAQLAAHRGLRQMSRVLLPSLSLARVLEAFEPTDAARSYGPPSLRAIAAAAMQAELMRQLDGLEAAQRAAQEAALADGPRERPCGACARAAGGVVCVDARQASTDDDASEAESPSEPPSPCSLSASSDASGRASLAGACARGGCSCGRAASAGLARAASSGWYEESCCVCWEEDVAVAIAPCCHALCVACARQLVASAARTGATCPLCRRYIAAFGLLPHGTSKAARARSLASTPPAAAAAPELAAA
ncbi:ankrd52 [Scenedesmus sp. PABB004]|nr:ankrd52 [Scenedesmus sp. PABB004]